MVYVTVHCIAHTVHNWINYIKSTFMPSKIIYVDDYDEYYKYATKRGIICMKIGSKENYYNNGLPSFSESHMSILLDMINV